MTHMESGNQAALWNGAAARGWVGAQALLDRAFMPFDDLLIAAVQASRARTVLDVGCGTGATTVAAAHAIGRDGSATGIDVSAPMIAAACARNVVGVRHAGFICADAETHPFEPESFDLIISRFGVMFFADPVRAFENLRRAARPGAALQCLAWRSAAENPFMTTAERAAAPLLPTLPPRQADGPGQFAFASSQRTTGILEASGWAAIDVRAVDVECTFPRHALADYVSLLGPVGRALQDADSTTRDIVLAAVLPAFDRFLDGDTVRFTAAIWELRATAS